MKINNYLKKALLIFLLLITCSLNKKVFALTINQKTNGKDIENALTQNQSLTFDYLDVTMNKYVYCMQKSRLLPHNNNTYIRDNSYIQLKYPYENGEGNDWAYLFAKNYERYGSGETRFGDSYLQHAFWYALGNDGNLQGAKTPAASPLPQSVNYPEKSFYGTVTQAFKTEQEMIKEAKAYKNFCAR